MKNKKKLVIVIILLLLIITGLSGYIIWNLTNKKNEPINNEKNAEKEVKNEYYKLNEDGTIYFADSKLENAIKEYTGEQKITKEVASKIKALVLDRKEIEDLTGIEFFDGLIYLDLSMNKIENLDNLSLLVNLEYLELGNNRIKDLTYISKLVNLKNISLNANYITDVSPLLSLKKLESLPILDSNYILNLDVLEENLDIYYINILNNNHSYYIDGTNIVFTEYTGYDSCMKIEDSYVCGHDISKAIDTRTIKTYKEAMKIAKEFVDNNITDSMSDMEKEQAISNYLVKNIEYQYTNGYGDGQINGTHDYYYPFVLHYGQCADYAAAFNLLAYLSGLESYVARSVIGTVTAGHAWNIVKIDGKYYHIDLTWGDEGDHVNSTYMNLSTSTMNKLHGESLLFEPNYITENFDISEDMDRKTVENYYPIP